MRALQRCIGLAAALLCLEASAQPLAPGKDIFKGKVKEGLYEMKTEHDMSGVPGIPKEAQKGSQTRQRCISKEEIERGMQAGKDCQVKSLKDAGATSMLRMECIDGTATDMKMTFAPGGYTSEMTTSGKQDGKPFRSVFRSTAKYLGACKS